MNKSDNDYLNSSYQSLHTEQVETIIKNEINSMCTCVPIIIENYVKEIHKQKIAFPVNE